MGKEASKKSSKDKETSKSERSTSERGATRLRVDPSSLRGTDAVEHRELEIQSEISDLY